MDPPGILIAGGGTGGHLMPALALADVIRRAHADWRIALAGAERGVEADLLPRRPWPYTLLPAEPIYRRQWWKNARWPFVARRLLRAVDQLLDAERPSLVIGTGGYASAPVVWRAAGRGIPTAIQEQNAYPGLTTRWLARRVRHIYLGVPEAAALLRPGPSTRVLHTGNPIAPPDRARRAVGRARFGITGDRPVVLVTGGSQGSLGINKLIAEWVSSGRAREMDLLWVTGKLTSDQFRQYHAPPAVHVIDFLDPMADGWAVADFAVARAGMMTIAELCAWGIPSILIPLPTAAADHQTPNARVLAEDGAAVFLPQAGLTMERLAAELERLGREAGVRHQMGNAALRRGRPEAAVSILGHLEDLLS